jgi:hypothetical protein
MLKMNQTFLEKDATFLLAFSMYYLLSPLASKRGATGDSHEIGSNKTDRMLFIVEKRSREEAITSNTDFCLFGGSVASQTCTRQNLQKYTYSTMFALLSSTDKYEQHDF